jgi:ParB-like chromosome segregation protein Spo0J
MNLQIEYLPTADLRAYRANARTHSDQQVAEIAASIRAFGFTSPILVDEQREIIAGHGRLEAARRVGLQTVPVVTLRGLSHEQIKALRLADNQISLHSGWDMETLAAEIEDLQTSDLDLGSIGFDEDFLRSLQTSPEEMADLAQNVGEMRDWSRPKPPQDPAEPSDVVEPTGQGNEADERRKCCPNCGFDLGAIAK